VTIAPGGGRGYNSVPEDSVRILHDGYAALRLYDDEERFLLVDPFETRYWHDVKGADAEAVVLTGGPWAERYDGVLALVKEGRRPRVVAPAPILDWLGKHGAIEGLTAPCTVAGTTIEMVPYDPFEPVTGRRDRVRAALGRPRWALDRFVAARDLPDAPPHLLRMVVPNGHTIAHLGVALHRNTDPAVLSEVRRLSEGAVVVAGYAHGEQDAFVEHITALAPRRLLLCDQTNDVRRAAGLPTALITPTRDVLVARNLETHPFVSGTSVRFEVDDTIKRW
jgi:hypothetical protein